MAEGGEGVVAIITPDCADDVAGGAVFGVLTFHQGKVVISCRAEQDFEVCAGIVMFILPAE